MFKNDDSKECFESANWIASYSPTTLYLAIKNSIKITKSTDTYYLTKTPIAQRVFNGKVSFHKESVNVTSDYLIRENYHCSVSLSKLLNCLNENYDNIEIGKYLALVIANEGEMLIKFENVGPVLSMTVLYIDIGDVRDEANNLIKSLHPKVKRKQIIDYNNNNATTLMKLPSIKLSKPVLLAVVISAIFFIISVFPKDV